MHSSQTGHQLLYYGIFTGLIIRWFGDWENIIQASVASIFTVLGYVYLFALAGGILYTPLNMLDLFLGIVASVMLSRNAY